jgi:hypothetical protein
MTSKQLLLLLFLSILATTLALPLPNDQNLNSNSLAQHLGQVGLWILGGATAIGLALGSVTYGTNWWHRFKFLQAEHLGNMTLWNATQARKEQVHQKNMEALDIILEVARNYTDSMGKETEFNPGDDIEKDEVEMKIAKDGIGIKIN